MKGYNKITELIKSMQQQKGKGKRKVRITLDIITRLTSSKLESTAIVLACYRQFFTSNKINNVVLF